MNFKDYKYVRPDFDKIKIEYIDLVNQFNSSNSAEEQYNIIGKINTISKTVDTMVSLVRVHNSIDTSDKFYDEENEYVDNMMPVYQGLVVEFYKALINSKFKEELMQKIHPQIFTLAEMEIRTFSDEVLSDLQEENKLSSQYSKLISSAKINFDNKILNLSQMQPYMESADRAVRKSAYEKWSQFFSDNMSSFDDIFDKMVKVRNKIATKLGYKNFTELSYVRMHRSDYNAADVAHYREQVLKYIVPLSNDLRKRQADRLGLDSLKYYDIPFEFTTGNPTPKGNKDWMLERAQKMYSELSNETKEFINFIIDRNLFDLDSKPNKQSGGYCTFFHNYGSPFIFANFNGTSGDVNVLTHEAGHAFQAYESKDYDFPEFIFPTYESSEIHSMGMEFITWPWMNLFFEEDELKYKFAHLADGILFIPYGVTVDEFQHIVYDNPDMTPTERRAAWRATEKKYTPYKDYEDNSFLDNGGLWFKQGHIFNSPFYYIDYTIAQVCAYQYWIKFDQDRASAWTDYLNLCKTGGSQPFLELLKIGNIKSPFDNETIKAIIPPIKEWLNKVDDSKL